MQEPLPPQPPLRAPETPRMWGPWQTFGFGLVIVAAFFAAQLVATVILVFTDLGSAGSGAGGLTNALTGREGLLVSVSAIFSSLVGIGLTAAVVRARKGVSFADYLGFTRTRLASVALSLGIVVGLILLSSAAASAIGEPLDSQFTADVYRTAVWPALLWPALVVFAPAFEEVFFRGFLFEGFRHSRMGAAGAVVVTSLAWSGLHVQYGLAEIAFIFFVGIALGIVRWRTGSLWNTLAMHAFINFLATLEVATGLYRMGA